MTVGFSREDSGCCWRCWRSWSAGSSSVLLCRKRYPAKITQNNPTNLRGIFPLVDLDVSVVSDCCSWGRGRNSHTLMITHARMQRRAHTHTHTYTHTHTHTQSLTGRGREDIQRRGSQIDWRKPAQIWKRPYIIQLLSSLLLYGKILTYNIISYAYLFYLAFLYYTLYIYLMMQHLRAGHLLY